MTCRLILLLLLWSPVIFSQVIQQSNYFWLRGGPGAFREMNGQELGGLSLTLSANFLNERTIKTKESVRNANDLAEIRLAGYANMGDEHSWGMYGDLGLLYGKCTGDVFRVFACAGIGIIGGMYATIERGPSGIPGTVDKSFLSLNLPVEAGINLNTEIIGLGLTGFVNINRTKSLIGLFITVQIGRIRKSTIPKTRMPEYFTSTNL